MLLKKHLLASLAVVGLVLSGCTSDEEAPEPVPETTPVEEPAAPPPIEESEPIAEPVMFTPETVYFAFDDYTLNQESRAALNALADHLKASNGTVVQIEGHCDERGSIEYNLALGERRAQSVKNYLTDLGVDPSRLSTISYGEEKPAVERHDEGAWSRNRRAEFVLSSQ